MNLLLLERSEIAPDGTVTLADRRAEHIRKILRAEVGRTLRVGVLGEGMGVGTVLGLSSADVSLAVEIRGEPPPPPWIDLIVALPRPAVLHRVLQTASAMGVGTLHLTTSWRVEKSFFSSPSLSESSIRKHLLLGAEQGMTTRIPEVHQHRLLVPFVRQLAEPSPEPCEPPRRLLAHPESALPIESAFELLPDRGRLEVAIGPEGGWIDREVETFREAGFQSVSLGPWILRVEAAVAATLAQVDLLQRSRSRRDG